MPQFDVEATTYGFPRFGQKRQLKKALEGHWAGSVSAEELQAEARARRAENLGRYAEVGLDEVPAGDFSLYDHVLDTSVMLGVVPEIYREAHPYDALQRYFAMARGSDAVPALEMTKWFDTNYHYLVPQIGPNTPFSLDADRLLRDVTETRDAGLTPRPVVIGPFTYLRLARATPDAPEGFRPLDRLEDLLPLYTDLLVQLRDAGCDRVQIDEPALVEDLTPDELNAVGTALAALTGITERPEILVATYFGRLGDAAQVLANSPVEAVGVDLVAGGEQALAEVLAQPGFADKRICAGVVDGRNVWATDLAAALTTLRAVQEHASAVTVTTSCSLLHSPIDLRDETDLPDDIRSWMAFAHQKLEEVATLSRALREGEDAVADDLAASRERVTSRGASTRIHRPEVAERLAVVSADDARRALPFEQRAALQAERLALPLFPTTTIGSFPQTAEVRRARVERRKGAIDEAEYVERMHREIEDVVRLQEELGLDVLVHGEPERNDMVQYFAENLDGFVTTRNGWVQSYGSRQVRPPILFGDVARRGPITPEWIAYAQSLTERPVKGMLTGPVTILAWSFVRDDEPIDVVADQVALALRDEVADLEAGGIAIVQVDEPGLRETLPLREADRAAYLDWATTAFRLATSGVEATTQIHTHMCYADFGDIFEAIDALDADAISLEAARSGEQLAGELREFGYRKGIGPGVYDIHSPRVPSVEEMAAVLAPVGDLLPTELLWVNPDCGLKTRGVEETRAALSNLVAVAARLREQAAATR